jgi:hypothetical protein
MMQHCIPCQERVKENKQENEKEGEEGEKTVCVCTSAMEGQC